MEKKLPSLGLSGTFGLVAAVLAGMGGGRLGKFGRLGKLGCVDDNQSGSELEKEGGVRVWVLEAGTGGGCNTLPGVGKSSSKVTHCWVCLVLAAGGGCWRGVRGGGREEGGARGRAGAGDGWRGGPNRDIVLWRWWVGTVVGARGAAGCVRTEAAL